MKKKIVLTGGGTAGHVIPNIALLPVLEKEYDISYIGSIDGIEKELIEAQDIPYFSISSGKFRRYFDLKNFTDIFRVLKGIFDSYKKLKEINPNIVFSKGGYVAVPVTIACKILGIPLIIHESDITPGLANKIAIPMSKALCISFPETMDNINYENVYLTGTPIRKELFEGDREKGLKISGFTDNKPCLVIMGGSQGSVKINDTIRESLDTLLKSFNIVHICGEGNIDKSLIDKENYIQFPYLHDELKDIYALADIIVSRAGANSIYEFLALKKPNLLIPLSRSASRGDQILNAESFKKQGFSMVLEEEELDNESLILSITDLYARRKDYTDNMENSKLSDGVMEITKVIKKYTK